MILVGDKCSRCDHDVTENSRALLKRYKILQSKGDTLSLSLLCYRALSKVNTATVALTLEGTTERERERDRERETDRQRDRGQEERERETKGDREKTVTKKERRKDRKKHRKAKRKTGRKKESQEERKKVVQNKFTLSCKPVRIRCAMVRRQSMDTLTKVVLVI